LPPLLLIIRKVGEKDIGWQDMAGGGMDVPPPGSNLFYEI
jgi:hypothetical protein